MTLDTFLHWYLGYLIINGLFFGLALLLPAPEQDQKSLNDMRGYPKVLIVLSALHVTLPATLWIFVTEARK